MEKERGKNDILTSLKRLKWPMRPNGSVENQAQLVWTCAYEEKDNVWKSVWAHFIVIRVVVEC